MKKLIIIMVVNVLLVNFAASQKIVGTYAIQNTVTNMNLRPYEAGGHDGNKIVSHNHLEWKCMTWEFIQIKDNTYQLKNLYTKKTFQCESVKNKQGAALEQQTLSSSIDQQWEFVKTMNNNYLIRLKGTELYITALSDQNNSEIILQPKQNEFLQLWRLVPQNPKN